MRYWHAKHVERRIFKQNYYHLETMTNKQMATNVIPPRCPGPVEYSFRNLTLNEKCSHDPSGLIKEFRHQLLARLGHQLRKNVIGRYHYIKN